jgi:hypothetical protein
MRQVLEQTLRQLDDDFYFIAVAILVQRVLSDDALARINKIADYRCGRTLDEHRRRFAGQVNT